MAETMNTGGATAVGDPGRGTAHAYATGGPPTALGKVIAVKEGQVLFAPAGTNYELLLACPNYAGPVNKPVRGIVRVQARKVWTVPSGGLFLTPIFGPPRIIQGRVRSVDPKALVVHAGCAIRVDLPDSDIVYDLASGPIRVGTMVNVTALPGATFELAK